MRRVIQKLGVLNKLGQNLYYDLIISRRWNGFEGVETPVRDGLHQTQSVDYTLLSESLPLNLIENAETIVDVGSGRGRVLGFLAWKYPQKRFFGYELNAAVLEESKVLLCPRFKNVSLELIDILTRSLPHADLFILFNPFDVHCAEKFFALLRSLPGATAVYINFPQSHDSLLLDLHTDTDFDVELIQHSNDWKDIRDKRTLIVSVKKDSVA
ncbi:MAG: class I SAM-dependent methyltransferase [Bdellovibrionaceae bacterium]|nr:class I SAM-dependent methyltransferase [Pseudobdellovibrionaceae bacterium]